MSEILRSNLLGVNSRSCHGPSCFCHAKNVEAHDVVVKGSAFGTRPAIVHYLQNNHSEDSSVYSYISKSFDLIHSQIRLTGRNLFIKLVQWIKDQNSYTLDMINKTDCLMGFAFSKARDKQIKFWFCMWLQPDASLIKHFQSKNQLQLKKKFSNLVEM